jgi:dipeptidyl aminopeptidase/acylaminoacyl peptidase
MAMTGFELQQPALFVLDSDGTARSRIHFDGVSDDVPGNLPPFILPVRDASIRALGPVRWSPDGNHLAAVVTVAFDQSQIVVMNNDGSDKRTASINTQIIMSGIAWSPDASRLAYTMSTTAGAGGIDLFITEIESSRVTRLTEGAALGVPGVSLAWSADGEAVIWSEITGTGPEPLFQRISNVNRVDIETDIESTLGVDITGQIFGITDDGQHVVIVRRVADAGTQFLEEVVVRRLADGQETVLTDLPEPIDWAAFTAGDERVIVASPLFAGSGLRFRMYRLDGSDETELTAVDANATSLDLAPRR